MTKRCTLLDGRSQWYTMRQRKAGNTDESGHGIGSELFWKKMMILLCLRRQQHRQQHFRRSVYPLDMCIDESRDRSTPCDSAVKPVLMQGSIQMR